MVQNDLAAFKRPLFVILVVGVLLHASSYNVVECQLNRSPRGLWGDLFGAVVTSLDKHVKRQRAREAAIAASSRLDQSAVNTIEENNLHSEPEKKLAVIKEEPDSEDDQDDGYDVIAEGNQTFQ